MFVARGYYGVVRRSVETGVEHVDTTEIGYLPEDARKKADAFDASFPQWARLYPQVRVARFLLQEIESD